MRNFFWFETSFKDREAEPSYYFSEPEKIIKLSNSNEIKIFFEEIENLTKKYYVAGFLSFELGYLFEDIFRYQRISNFPFAIFAIYKKPVSNKKIFAENILDYKIDKLRLNLSKRDYFNNIRKVKEYIHNGDIYQVNYTMKYKFNFSGSPLGLYLDLKKKQRVAYNCFLNFEDYYILSLSPELFFYKKKNYIKVKPMKGTIRRGKNIYEDRENSKFLQNDIKNRSENIMIVDLLRNDLGKISEKGSVKVRKLFEVEKYDTLFQMTSTIESHLKKNITIYELIKSIFPSGSVTGAPKIRSMEIIRQLEKEERKIYTGAIGFWTPEGEAKFNVAIRTILIQENRGEMGIGGGIVYDSLPDDEFEEAKLKAYFLIKKPVKDFSIIETILFEKDYQYLNLHLRRMKETAKYFDFKINEKELLYKLRKLKKSLQKESRYKVRVLLSKDGKLEVLSEEIKSNRQKYRIKISEFRTDSNNIFLYHKTTNRELYDEELKKARKNGYFDVIFFNTRGELTEGSITNIYIKKDGIIYTPPIESGLLNGIIREVFINEYNIKEKRLYIKDLRQADEMFVSNSIVGFQRAILD